MEGRYDFHSILDHIIIIDENIFKIEGYRERERKEGEKDREGINGRRNNIWKILQIISKLDYT